ncbi:MAG: hypothetical protein IAC32_04695 [Bacteroidetes bacterium]|uniref:Uncharacterized protein n=1 Tax=Candidatus Enterocola intestinipullorum TaxID=2840783 RepID=A0A9D9EHL7_9BACT|nr:hypothetical protein [Candidatus Enterocola intestinipullorum]
MNRTLLIIILIISVVAFIGSIYVCIVQLTGQNIMIAALLLLVSVYEAWQIRKTSKNK